jgi:hypothetical protein
VVNVSDTVVPWQAVEEATLLIVIDCASAKAVVSTKSSTPTNAFTWVEIVFILFVFVFGNRVCEGVFPFTSTNEPAMFLEDPLNEEAKEVVTGVTA